jgi:hypothetical protein
VAFYRVDCLLVAAGKAVRENLVAMLESCARQARASSFDARVGVALTPSPVDATRFDAVLSIGLSGAGGDALVGMVEGLSRRLDGLADAEGSAVIAGAVDVVIPGDGRIFSLYPLRPAASLSVADFYEHWTNVHRKLAQAVPGLRGYRQFRADLELTGRAAMAAGFRTSDFLGVAEGRRPGMESTVIPGPELDIVLADERNFIDVGRCAATIYEATPGAEAFGG